MTRPGARLPALLAVLSGLLGVACGDGFPQTAAPTHVVLVSIDTLRRDHLTPYGYPRDTSPNLQALARSGIVFENAFAANSNTAPSHATMLTGLHPRDHGVVRNGYPLGHGVKTLAQRLGRAYHRAAFVSGYPMQRAMTGFHRGFDHYDDDFGDDWQRPAAETVDRVEEWLEARGGDPAPLLLFVHLYDPHHPYDAPAPFAQRFLPAGQQAFRFPGESAYESFWSGEASRAELLEYVVRYDGEIAYADHHVGRLFSILARKGFWDGALVIVVSDHGETLDERAAPFAHGARLYDEQLRVPLLLRLPGDRHAGTRVEAPAHHVDLLPTILDLLGLDPEPGLAGVSLRPWVEEERVETAARAVYGTALPQGWRVPELDAELEHDALVASIRIPGWKLVAYPGVEGSIYQLFDLRADPGETKNLAAEDPAKRRALRAQLEAWLGTGDLPAAPVPLLSAEEEEALRALGYLSEAP